MFRSSPPHVTDHLVPKKFIRKDGDIRSTSFERMGFKEQLPDGSLDHPFGFAEECLVGFAPLHHIIVEANDLFIPMEQAVADIGKGVQNAGQPGRNAEFGVDFPIHGIFIFA